MKHSAIVLAAGLSGLIGIGLETTAHAQVCTQSSPGVAAITTTTAATALKVVGGTTRANAVNCGFLATSIVVTGNTGDETLTLTSIPATVRVTMDLGGGVNNLVIYTTDGDDTLTCGAASCNRDAVGSVDAIWTGTTLGRLTIHGKAGNDRITVTNYLGVTSLYGEDGDDIITGGGANDTIVGGNGNDTMSGGAGNDTFTTLAAFDGFDTINGNAGIDTATYAARQGDVFLGLEGSEDVIGNSTENITGGPGNDTLDFDSSTVARTIRGGAGSDLVRGGAGADKLYGGLGDDTIIGGGGADTLYGEDGIDDLTGGPGNDVYNGGAGDDVIFSNDAIASEVVKCQTGVDTYVATNDTFTGCENPTAVTTLTNGSFETGSYSGWTIFDEVVGGEDIWGIGTDGVRINQNDLVHDFESGLDQTYVCGDGPTPTATDGGATSVELQYYQSSHRMYQDVTVPANAQLLWLSMGYLMFGSMAQPDPTFDPANQYIALTLRDPMTDAVLTNGELFKLTEGAAPDSLPMINLWADVTAFAGQSVRVSVDITAINFCIPVQFDNFKFLVTAAAPFAPDAVQRPTFAGLAKLSAARAAPAVVGDDDEPAADADEVADLDDELDGDDTTEAGGGCSTGGGGGSLATGLLIGLALVTRRRRAAPSRSVR